MGNAHILNEDHHIATLTEGAVLDIELEIEIGKGYVLEHRKPWKQRASLMVLSL